MREINKGVGVERHADDVGAVGREDLAIGGVERAAVGARLNGDGETRVLLIAKCFGCGDGNCGLVRHFLIRTKIKIVERFLS